MTPEEENALLKQQVRIFEQALQFYANMRRYGNPGGHDCLQTVSEDAGRTARKAMGEVRLLKLEGGKS